MKTITMYRPAAIHNALSDFDRCFESFFDDSLAPASALAPANVFAPASRVFNHLPAVDIQETESAYKLDMELPGYDEKNIEVHVDGANLSISSRQEENKEEQKNENAEGNQGGYILRERRTSAFSRSFKLPENADPETVSAEFRNGILSMEIKKRAEAQKRTIQINAKN